MDSSKDISGSDASISTNTSPTDPLSLLSRTIKNSRKVFVGTYLERRYVNQLQAYRDIVVIDNDQHELIECLKIIQKVAEQQYGTSKWLGITCDMKDSIIQNYSLWVELQGVPLGNHWFQLRSVKHKGPAIQLNVRYLKMFETHERRLAVPKEYPTMDYRELFTNENACNTIKFLAVLVMSLLTVACNAIWYLGDFGLKFTHELSGMIRALTPIFFGMIDFFTKCVGGLYWLLYMIWVGDSAPTYPSRPPIQPYNRRSKNYVKKAIAYNPKIL